MALIIEAMYDGVVLHPLEPLKVEANTQVRVTVEVVSEDPKPPRSFLRTAIASRIEGPADWATNLDSYLYGDDNEPS